jgi:hypothetical protein
MGFSGCGQDPLFYHISYEEEPVDPFIQGGPGKIAADSAGKLYVSNGRVFRYTYDEGSKTGSWSPLGGEPGMVYDIGLAGDTLYTMTLDGSSSAVWKQGAASPLTNNTDYSFVQSIFGTTDRLFAGARQAGSTEDYGILYEDGGKLSLLSNKHGGLSGAVELGENYYLATTGNGILAVPKNAITPDMTLSPLPDTGELHIMALLQFDGKLAAAVRDGRILIYDPATDTIHTTSYGNTFTGAFSLWKNPDDSAKRLFLVGIWGSSSHGYREIPIQADGSLGTIRAPGEGEPGWTTVSNNAKYNSSLEKHPVNSLFVAPKEFSTEDNLKYPVIFASTQQDGLWVYRDGSWKAQD